MFPVDLDELRRAFGMGVAGNFAGHLEQAGEDGDFVAVEAASPDAPKGLFPFYVPGHESFLGVFPLSHDRISIPRTAEAVNLQIEPEAALLCTVDYLSDEVTRIAPTAIGAFNDCSIRRPGASKISHKKNWGPDSKGIAARFFPIGDLDPEGATAHLRLACFLRRGGETHPYGIDSPLPGYSFYGDRLLSWIVDRLANQRGSDDTPLEPVGEYLADAGRPGTILVGIGATRYTPLGEGTYLEADDEALVVVYDSRRTSPDDLEVTVGLSLEDELSGASVLRQVVELEP